jgi:hypothetical protein
MTAADFEFPGDHLVHRYTRRLLVARHQADLHVAAAFSQAVDRVETDFGIADRIQREVRAAARQVSNGVCNVAGGVRVNRAERTNLFCELELVVGEVHGDHARAERVRDHDRRQPDAAAAVHGDPLAFSHPPLVDYRPE